MVHEVSEPQMHQDLSIWNRRCWLQYAPRRFECERCGNTLVERMLWREPGLDSIRRYEQAVYERARRKPVAQIAQSEGLSEDQQEVRPNGKGYISEIGAKVTGALFRLTRGHNGSICCFGDLL
jgi:hypothetical protein